MPALILLVPAAMRGLGPNLFELLLLLRIEIQLTNQPTPRPAAWSRRRRRRKVRPGLNPHRQPSGERHQKSEKHDEFQHHFTVSPVERSSAIHCATTVNSALLSS